MMDLVSWPHFFIEAAIGLDINKVMGLAINKAISIEIDIVIDFLGCFYGRWWQAFKGNKLPI